MIDLTFSSALRQIKDKENVLYDRINIQDYNVRTIFGPCLGSRKASGMLSSTTRLVATRFCYRYTAEIGICFNRWHSRKCCMNRIVN